MKRKRKKEEHKKTKRKKRSEEVQTLQPCKPVLQAANLSATVGPFGRQLASLRRKIKMMALQKNGHLPALQEK